MSDETKRWKPGTAEKAYDMLVMSGLNPVPWQFDLLQRIENQHVDAEFRDITSGVSDTNQEQQ